LWRYTLDYLLLIGLLIGGGIIAAAYYLADDAGAHIADLWPFGFWEETIRSIANVIGGFIIAVLGIILYKHIVMIAAAPFMTPISEKIEMHLTGRELDITNTPQEYIGAIARAAKINIQKYNLGIDHHRGITDHESDSNSWVVFRFFHFRCWCLLLRIWKHGLHFRTTCRVQTIRSLCQ
jgi:CysZ protein